MSIAQKMPIKPAFFSLFFALSWGIPSQAIPKKQPSANLTCKPLGRVVQVHGYSFSTGQIICAGQKLHGSTTAMLSLFCFDTLKNVTYNGATQDFTRKCQSRSMPLKHECNGTQNLAQCSRGSGSQLDLIRPFGNTITETKPRLEWESVQGATHYKVVVDGFDVNWQKIVNGNRLGYPKDQPSLKYGNKYELTFFAYRQNKLLTTQQSSLILLPEQEVRKIQQGVKKLKQIPHTQAQLAKDLDHIYMTRDLQNKAIQTLESISETPAATPEIRQLLAQRLEEAGHRRVPVTDDEVLSLPLK